MRGCKRCRGLEEALRVGEAVTGKLEDRVWKLRDQLADRDAEIEELNAELERLRERASALEPVEPVTGGADEQEALTSTSAQRRALIARLATPLSRSRKYSMIRAGLTSGLLNPAQARECRARVRRANG